MSIRASIIGIVLCVLLFIPGLLWSRQDCNRKDTACDVYSCQLTDPVSMKHVCGGAQQNVTCVTCQVLNNDARKDNGAGNSHMPGIWVEVCPGGNKQFNTCGREFWGNQVSGVCVCTLLVGGCGGSLVFRC